VCEPRRKTFLTARPLAQGKNASSLFRMRPHRVAPEPPVITGRVGAPSENRPVFPEQCSAIYWAKLSDVCIHQHRTLVVQRGSSLLPQLRH
jgi:hypothetical protein